MRKLTLKKETVAELSTGELAAVIGGNTHKLCISGIVECLPTRDCPTNDFACTATLTTCAATLDCG